MTLRDLYYYRLNENIFIIIYENKKYITRKIRSLWKLPEFFKAAAMPSLRPVSSNIFLNASILIVY